jgi:hypothetical protein
MMLALMSLEVASATCNLFAQVLAGIQEGVIALSRSESKHAGLLNG